MEIETMSYSPSTRTAAAVIALLGAALLSAGCQDSPSLFEPSSQREVPMQPVFTPDVAMRLTVPVEDVLTRIIPSADGAAAQLGQAVGALAIALPVADGAALRRHLDTVSALAANAVLDEADVDALRLAMEPIAIALDAPDRAE
jgi:hypothetical protein